MALIVPEVVVMEVANRQREEITAAVRKAAQATNELWRLGAIDEPLPLAVNTDQTGEEAERNLRQMLSDLGAEISAIPEPSHRSLVERALRRKQPFGKDDSGYRDALIWETVRLLAADRTPLTFVSQDRKAFHAPSGSNELSPDLAADLRDGLTETVEIMHDLQSVVDAYVDRELVLLQQTQIAFKTDSIKDQILELVARRLPGESIDWDKLRDIDTDDIDLESTLETDEEVDWVEVESASAGRPFAMHYLSVLDARTLDGEKVGVEFEAEVDAAVDLSISAGIRRREVSPASGEIEISHAQVWTEHNEDRTLHVVGEATFNPAEGNVEDVAVVWIRA